MFETFHETLRSSVLPQITSTGKSGAQSFNSLVQLITNGLGQTIKTFFNNPDLNNNRIETITCMVFPKPISSAIKADFLGIKKAIPLI